MRSSDRVVLDGLRATGGSGVGLLAVAVLDPVSRLMLPAALAAALDAAIGDASGTRALWYVCGLLVAATACEIAREVLEKRSVAFSALSLRRSILHHALALGSGGRRMYGQGDLLSRLLESTHVTATAGQTLVVLVTSALTSVGGLVALFLIDARLALAFAVGAPLMWWLTRRLMSDVGSATAEYQGIHGEVSERFVDALRGARTIRAVGTAEQEVERVLAPLPRLRASGMGFWEIQRRAIWHAGLLTPLLQIAVLAVGGYGLLKGRITPGELLASQVYLEYALGLLKQTMILAVFARARGSAERIAELYEERAPSPGTRPLPPGNGQLTLRDVHVVRDGNALLTGVDLEVPAGRSVAVIGASGSGKSTLTEVAGGLLRPDSGQVLLDGAPVDEVRPDELRHAVGYAFERPVLLGDTLGDALAYADRPPDRERVSAALEDSSAAAFVHRLPYGLRTPLHQVRLSGGELQRLGLARVACRDSRLVVLDDATSSVDSATEAEITAALDRALRGSTRLIVAHRMSTAAGADLVAWLEGGKLRALAPHGELLAEPDYRAVFQPPGRDGEDGNGADGEIGENGERGENGENGAAPALAGRSLSYEQAALLREIGAEHPTLQLRVVR
ncbi:ABC transporter ATP-binding protein [Streptomyces armeniacus]|uniref:ABC transporter ATP-binding protein n=1 Tax=Streptomyces armeniacus TaxID=83291 RepID=UPI001AD8130E|nr:ABC transporter ATP-binding protein [Streptomyces armeniacus]